MKDFTNKYIFTFISLLIIVVAVVLSLTYLVLKPFQDNNIRIEQMKNILSSVNVYVDDKKIIEKNFNKYITDKFVIDYYGNVIENLSPEVLNLKMEIKKLDKINLLEAKKISKNKSRATVFFEKFFGKKEIDTIKINQQIESLLKSLRLPVYRCKKDSIQYTILALYGKGLWGPIWGYISFYPNYSTVYGVYFDHKSETPGLGAEINTLKFQKQFNGKNIFIENKLVSIKLIKGNVTNNNYEVNAISGGTITSKGLEKMLFDCLSGYYNYLIKEIEKLKLEKQ